MHGSHTRHGPTWLLAVLATAISISCLAEERGDVSGLIAGLLASSRSEITDHIRGIAADPGAESGAVQLLDQNARGREWIAHETRRLEELARTLKLRNQALPVSHFKDFAAGVRTQLDERASRKRDSFSYQALEERNTWRLKAEKWYQTEVERLAILEQTHPNLGKSVVAESDPPVIRELLRRYEEAARVEARPAAGGTFEDWQRQVDARVAAHEGAVELRAELLERYQGLRNRAIETPDEVAALTKENMRTIEKAAIERFHIDKQPDSAHDPALRERKLVLDRLIRSQWEEILLAHDAEWMARLENLIQEDARLKPLLAGCEKRAGRGWASGSGVSALSFLLSAGTLLTAGAKFGGSYSDALALAGVATALALTPAFNAAERLWDKYTLRRYNDAVGKAQRYGQVVRDLDEMKKNPATEATVRQKVAGELASSAGSCLDGVLEQLLRWSPSAILEAGAREGAAIAGARVRIGTKDSAPDPLRHILDPDAREAAEHGVFVREAEAELDAFLKRGGLCGRNEPP